MSFYIKVFSAVIRERHHQLLKVSQPDSSPLTKSDPMFETAFQALDAVFLISLPASLNTSPIFSPVVLTQLTAASTSGLEEIMLYIEFIVFPRTAAVSLARAEEADPMVEPSDLKSVRNCDARCWASPFMSEKFPVKRSLPRLPIFLARSNCAVISDVKTVPAW